MAERSSDMSSLLSSLLSNPEILSKVSDTLRALEENANGTEKKISDNGSGEAERADGSGEEIPSASAGEESADGDSPPSSPTSAPPFINPFAEDSEGARNRSALLRALRPYLSPRRREVLDGIMRMSMLGDMVKKISEVDGNVLQ